MRRLTIRSGLLAVAAAGLLSACSLWASPPKYAEILVTTAPPGASCVLSRGGQPIATAEPTPAIALVDPAVTGVAVTCRRQAYEEVTVPLPPPVGSVYQQRIDIAMAPRAPR
jgi:hypothetical protein